MTSDAINDWTEPGSAVLNLYLPVKLYKAPPNNRPMEAKPPSTPIVSQTPVELLHLILLELDLTSLGMLRRVNTTTRNLVESLPAYSLLRKHASGTLRVMDATKCTSYFPIRWIFTELCHPRCRTCPDFGAFLYLPTMSRSCFQCNLCRPEYQVVPTYAVKVHFGLCPRDIKSLPTICNLPCLPGERCRHRMVDLAQAKALALRLHGSSKKLEEDTQMYKTYLVDVMEWRGNWGRVWQKALRRQDVPLQVTVGDVVSGWRMLATTSLPYWNGQKGILEVGQYCPGCSYHWKGIEEGQIRLTYYHSPHPLYKKACEAYLETDLQEHLLHCPAFKTYRNVLDMPGY